MKATFLRSLTVPAALLAFTSLALAQNETVERLKPIRVTPAPPTEPQALPVAPSAAKGSSANNYSRVLSAGSGGGGVSFSTSSSAGIPPVVVRFSGVEEEANTALEEDLNIMTHLLERSLQRGIGDETPEVKSGIPILLSDGRSVRGLYLDGFGALFMIKVRFPVFAPNPSEAKAPQPAADSEWDKVKRELYSDAHGQAVEVLIGGSSQYDAEQVEELKKALLQTLKYAANIHQLKPSDSIAITVFGQPSTALQIKRTRSNKESSNGSPQKTTAGVAPTAEYPRASVEPGQATRLGAVARDMATLRTSSQGTVLTLRVKKTDVDAFASGKLDFEAFRKKAELTSYAGSGYGITSINSWSKTGVSSGTIGR